MRRTDSIVATGRKLFADQFVWYGTGYIYRRSMAGVPIPVSDLERDGFVETFNRRIGYLEWAAVPGTLVGIMLILAASPDPDGAAILAVACGEWLLVFTVSAIIARRLWSAPERALERERRMPVGIALTADEVRGCFLARITYQQLLLAPVAVLLPAWKMSERQDGLHVLGRWWLAVPVVFALLAVIQAFRKWRTERSA